MTLKLAVAALAAVCVALVAPVAAWVLEDEIHELPGWDGPLPSKWFSGYLHGGKKEGRDLWYHYVLILSEGSPETDPLVLWTNGGPGASSLWGLMTELGPFYLSSKSLFRKNDDGVPQLFSNGNTWTKHANLLVLSGPPPVSFSYCDPPGQGGTGFECGSAWNDTSTAKANYNFLESFFEAYPTFRDSDFYLTGESYAGIYIPTLTREILQAPASSRSRAALKGIAIGNGCIGKDIICSGANGEKVATHERLFQAEFLFGHGQISPKLYREVRKECDASGGDFSDECEELLAELKRQAGGYFEYALYDECWADQSLPFTSSRGLGGGYPCGGGAALKKWISAPSVRDALGVPKEARFVSGDDSAALAYDLTERNLIDFMRKLALETDLRVLIYSGDTDPTVNMFATFYWVEQMGINEITPWTPWTLDGGIEMGGYVTRFEGDFDFLTIRGSGHMVPQMKPRAALEMLSRWLRNEPWLPYKPKPKPEAAVHIPTQEAGI